MRTKRIPYLCILFVCAVTRVTAQQAPEDQSDSYEGVGFGIEGAPGVFTVPFPLILPQGQIGVSVSFVNDFGGTARKAILPFSLTLGMAERVELYASLMTTATRRGGEDNRSSVGVRIGVFSDQNSGLLATADARVRRHEISDAADQYALTSMMARGAIATRIVGNLRLNGFIGYAWGERDRHSGRTGLLWGGSLTTPATDDLLLGADITLPDDGSGSGDWTGAAGVKWFALKNFHLSLGVRGKNIDGTLIGGIVAGVSFTSGHMFMLDGNPDVPTPLLPEPPPLDDIPDGVRGSAEGFRSAGHAAARRTGIPTGDHES